MNIMFFVLFILIMILIIIKNNNPVHTKTCLCKSGVVHNNQKVEKIQMPINWWTEKKMQYIWSQDQCTMEYYTAVDICSSLDEPWKQDSQERSQFQTPHIGYSIQTKCLDIKTRNIPVVAWGWLLESRGVMEYEVSSAGNKIFKHWMVAQVCGHVKNNCTLYFKWVNVGVCDLYLNKALKNYMTLYFFHSSKNITSHLPECTDWLYSWILQLKY